MSKNTHFFFLVERFSSFQRESFKGRYDPKGEEPLTETSRTIATHYPKHTWYGLVKKEINSSYESHLTLTGCPIFLSINVREAVTCHVTYCKI